MKLFFPSTALRFTSFFSYVTHSVELDLHVWEMEAGYLWEHEIFINDHTTKEIHTLSITYNSTKIVTQGIVDSGENSPFHGEILMVPIMCISCGA